MNKANELSLANVGGVFVVLMAGMGLACLVAVFEFIWKSRKAAGEGNVSKTFEITCVCFARCLFLGKGLLLLSVCPEKYHIFAATGATDDTSLKASAYFYDKGELSHKER